MSSILRNGICVTVVIIIIFATGGCNNQAAGTENESRWVRSLKKDLSQWPQRLLSDSNDTFIRADNMTALLLAGGASVVMHRSTDADDNIAKNFERHRAFAEFPDRALDFIGGPGPQIGLSGIWYIISAENDDQLNQDRAWTMITALSITDITVTGLKAVVHNDTPNDKSWAWPSGHTASSFTAASVLDEFYGPGVGIPAYLMASTVAWRMMDTGDHWGSDVVFGATLGWVVGHTVAGRHKQLEIAGFKLLPYAQSMNEPIMGVSLLRRF